jgi:hypothetical protein
MYIYKQKEAQNGFLLIKLKVSLTLGSNVNSVLLYSAGSIISY